MRLAVRTQESEGAWRDAASLVRAERETAYPAEVAVHLLDRRHLPAKQYLQAQQMTQAMTQAQTCHLTQPACPGICAHKSFRPPHTNSPCQCPSYSRDAPALSSGPAGRRTFLASAGSSPLASSHLSMAALTAVCGIGSRSSV